MHCKTTSSTKYGLIATESIVVALNTGTNKLLPPVLIRNSENIIIWELEVLLSMLEGNSIIHKGVLKKSNTDREGQYFGILKMLLRHTGCQGSLQC